MLDYSVFVDVEHAIQLDRRIYRDQDNRGYKRSDIIYQWDNHVMPCYESYIAPYVSMADFHFRNDHRAGINKSDCVRQKYKLGICD